MNKQPMYIKGDIALIAKYNRFDESVEIGDLNNASDGWVTYDPTPVSYTHLTLPTSDLV